MKKLLIGIAVVVVVLVAAVVAMAFSLLPNVALDLNDVTFAGPPGARTPEMVRLGRLELVLTPLPLLQGRVEIDRLILREPRIALEVDAQGRPNWVLDQAQVNGQGQPEPAPAPAPSGGGEQQAGKLPELRLGDVELIDGQV